MAEMIILNILYIPNRPVPAPERWVIHPNQFSGRIEYMVAPDFEQTPQFSPQLTPKEMLELGVFGGCYFEGEHDEYPSEWFASAKLSSSGFDVGCNYFETTAGQSREVWLKKGWITPHDPLGWFQWYCRYVMGRRLEKIDDFQIARWRAFGPRHIGGIKANCEPGNIWCRPRQRQALLQWAYDPFF